jgi:hypothetical protein
MDVATATAAGCCCAGGIRGIFEAVLAGSWWARGRTARSGKLGSPPFDGALPGRRGRGGGRRTISPRLSAARERKAPGKYTPRTCHAGALLTDSQRTHTRARPLASR